MHELYLVLAVLAITGAAALLAVRRRAPSCDACGDRAAATLCLRCLDGRRVRPEPLPMAPPPCCAEEKDGLRLRVSNAEHERDKRGVADLREIDGLRAEIAKLQRNIIIKQGRPGERF